MENSVETPSRGILLVATPLAVLVAAFMFFFFATDEWTTARIIGQAGFTAIAFGLVVATVFPQKGLWGLRIVTFTIFAAYLSYLINQFWFSGNELEVLSSRSQATPFNAILGFLVFGAPCLLYTLWGSTWGKVGLGENANINRMDVVVFWFAWGTQILFLGLSALVVVVWAIRWWNGS